jgi:two-component response regulator (ARR-B family)
LQKFRLYLKRLSGVAQQQSGVSNTICGPVDPNVKLGSLGRFDIPALAAGQIPPQTLAALHAELLGRPAGNLVGAMEQPALLQASLQGPKRIPVEHGVAFGQPLVNCQSNVSKHFQQSIIPPVEDVSSGLGAWPSNNLGPVAPNNNLGAMSAQNNNMLMDILQQQQRKQQQESQQQSLLSEPSRSINVQPSCLVAPSQPSANFQAGNSPASVGQNCSFNRSSVVDYTLLSSQSNNSPLNIGQFSNGALKSTGVLSGYSASGSISPSVSSCPVTVDNVGLQGQTTITFNAARQLPGTVPSMHDIQASYVAKRGEVLDQGPLRNLGFVSKGTCIPSRFAVDDFESQMNNLSHGKLYVENNRVKQEPSVEYMDNSRAGVSILQQFSSDGTSVFTE